MSFVEIRKLREFLRETPEKEFTLWRLIEVAGDSDRFCASEAILSLVREGTLKQFVRVETTESQFVGNYESILSVPNDVINPHTGMHTTITPESIKVMFRVL